MAIYLSKDFTAKCVFIFLMFCCAFLVDAQHTVYKVTDVSPQYIGGEDSLTNYLSNNLIFPRDTAFAKLETAVVVVRFLVYEDGSLGDFNIIRTEGDAFSEEAIRVLKSSEPWISGHNNNGPSVTTQYQLPVIFHRK